MQTEQIRLGDSFELQVDCVLISRLPLKDILASSWVVWTTVECDDEPVVVMHELRHQVIKDARDVS